MELYGPHNVTEEELTKTQARDSKETSPSGRRQRRKASPDFYRHLKLLWNSNRQIHEILKYSASDGVAREKLFGYLEQKERDLLHQDNDLHTLERANARECIRVLKSVISPLNEQQTGVSSFKCLYGLAKNQEEEIIGTSIGFLLEFIHLFRGVIGKSGIYGRRGEQKKLVPQFLRMKGRKAAAKRTSLLDHLSENLDKYFKKYLSGMEEEVIRWRSSNRDRLLDILGGQDEDWEDYQWHLDHVITDPKVLDSIIELTEVQRQAVQHAVENRIPFGITPYYAALMDRTTVGYDHAIRSQVIPPPEYVERLAAHKTDRETCFDFMAEHDTSPVDLVTRRYPNIAILKPYNTCAQICVYCQRNWEIEECMAPDALADKEKILTALAWFDEHPEVGEVLVTGGDPCVCSDGFVDWILGELSKRRHIFRVRLGTRTPVVLPFRWTESLVDILAKYHEPGRREICVVTHFMHPYEITPDATAAIARIRRAGMSVYNQEVFTIDNSRRFETSKLRRLLRLSGVDPYYTFNMKGKDETRQYMVPIARLLQERKEEARLLPGLDRTDEPVFNVPRLGKNHLRSWQDHRVVMIRPDTGARIYEFHPWEKNIAAVPGYQHTDVPIHDYLETLASRGENVHEYRTIWYYY